MKTRINTTRIILATLLVLSFTLALAACGGSTLTGKYVITDLINDPEGVTFAEMDEMYKNMGLDIADYLYMELLDGERFKLVMFGEEEASGRYTAEGSTLTLTAEGGTTTADISGKTITWTYKDGAKLVLKKK